MNLQIKSKLVYTNKDHQCHGCLERVPKGSQMHVKTFAGEEGIGSSHFCLACNAFWDTVDWDDYDEGVAPGDFNEDTNYKQFKQDFYARQGLLQTSDGHCR